MLTNIKFNNNYYNKYITNSKIKKQFILLKEEKKVIKIIRKIKT